MNNASPVPPTLTADLIDRLAVLGDQPEGVAEVALSALAYGSLASLAAHEIIADVDPETDAAHEIVITQYGRQVIDACARLRAVAGTLPLDGELVDRLKALAGEPEGVAEVALSALSHAAVAALIAHDVIEPVDLDGDEPYEIVITGHGRRLIDAYGASTVNGGANGHRRRASASDEAVNLLEHAALVRDGGNTPLQVGTVARLDGPPPRFEDIIDHIGGRLHLIPRCRQKLAGPLAWPAPIRWVDDPALDLEYHVRHVALPQPGDEAALERLAGRIFSQHLDRSKPLWELWVVEGLSGGDFALISKTHFALADHLTGVELLMTLYDLTPEPTIIAPEDPWVPDEEPSPVDLAASTAGEALLGLMRLPLRVAGATVLPWRAVGKARRAVDGVADIAWAGRHPAPRSPLNGPVGPHRRVAFVDASLDDHRVVKDALGGTVNDAVLGSVAGALRTLLRTRGVPDDEMDLKAVAVSTRGDRDEGPFVGRMTQSVTPLPVSEEEALERHRQIRDVAAPASRERAQAGARPNALAQIVGLALASRVSNLMIANVAGSPFQLYFLGRPMQSLRPVPFLTGNHALAIGALSYNGRVHYGLVGDPEVMPDLELLAVGLEDGLSELLEAASAGHETAASSRLSRS